MTIPSHIGQYRIVRKIGAGGMGMVFLGEHMLLGRRAAIKTLLPTVAVNPEIVERFFNEARAASAISDPGVIQIFDFGYHVDGTAYIVMELLEGEALSARIDRLGKLPVADAIRIARQIAGSLAAAHACNIVHRDLKPENIFLVRDGEAQGGERTKILDFGICKLGPTNSDVAVTQIGAMVGTPVYMSPEQCRGSGDVDHRSDIYAFGCLLFHVLTGRPPFIGESSGDLIVAHIQADPPAPSVYVADLPFEIDAVLLRCLAKSPDERFPSMAELHLVLGDIYAALDATESTIDPVTPAMQLGQGFRSVYDANFTGFTHGGSRVAPPTHRLRPQLRFLSTPPATPPKLRPLRRLPGRDTDEELAALLRPRRRAIRAVFAGVVIVGVAIALATSPLIRDDQSRTAVAGTGAPASAPPVEQRRAAAPSDLDPASSTSATAPPVDRTVERTHASNASEAGEPPAVPIAPFAGPLTSETPIAAPAESSLASGRDESRTSAERSGGDGAAADRHASQTARAAEKPAAEKPVAEKPVVEKVAGAGPEKAATGNSTTGTPGTADSTNGNSIADKSTADKSTADKSTADKSAATASDDAGPVVTPSEADPPPSRSSSRAIVTTLRKPDAARESRQGRSRAPAARPTPSSPPQPQQPPPTRPPASNEDLYDTR